MEMSDNDIQKIKDSITFLEHLLKIAACKHCRICKKELPNESFENGRRTCRSCVNSRHKQYYQNKKKAASE